MRSLFYLPGIEDDLKKLSRSTQVKFLQSVSGICQNPFVGQPLRNNQNLIVPNYYKEYLYDNNKIYTIIYTVNGNSIVINSIV